MNNFIIDIERDFYKNFYELLNNIKKEELFQVVGEENLDNIMETKEILDILETNTDDIIYDILHYGLEVYIEVFKDDVGNTIPYYLLIGKVFSGQFYGIEIEYAEGHYKTNIIVGNNLVYDENADVLLKKQLGEKAFNDILSFSNDLLLYDDYVGTYVAMANPYEENFSHKEIYYNINGKLIYINSTIFPDFFNFKR